MYLRLDKDKLECMGYEVKERDLNEVIEFSKGPFIEIVHSCGGFHDVNRRSPVYERAEHSPTSLFEKLPNITLLDNLRLKSDNAFIYGQSVGHSHPENGLRVQEIYEFFNYGAMLIASRDEAEKKWAKLYVAKPNTKVIVPGNCMMTLFNLDPFNRFLTADMSNPRDNIGETSVQRGKGMMMVLYNKNHFNRISIALNKEYSHFGINGKNNITNCLNINCKNGLEIANALLKGRNFFKQYGIEVVKARKTVRCKDSDGENYVLDKSLDELIFQPPYPLHKIFRLRN